MINVGYYGFDASDGDLITDFGKISFLKRIPYSIKRRGKV